MARKVTAWACSWGCGRSVLTSKAQMEKHEDRCFHNPSVKSCKTCRHNDYETPEPDVGIAGGHFCHLDVLDQKIAKRHCDKWESKP